MIKIKLSILVVFFIISLDLNAQSLTNTVLASSGGSTSAGGVQLNWTLGETVTPTLAAGTIVLTQGFQQPELQIWTGNVNTAICAGSTVTVPYMASGVISTNNKFIAELSDAKGRFNNPVVVGGLIIKDNINGTLIAKIPSTAVTGGNYRIRVKSSTPQFAGTDNGESITISRVVAEIPDAYASAYTSAVLVNTIYNGWISALTLKARVIEGIPPFSYVWKNSAGGIVGRSNTYKVTAADTYTLTVIDSKGCTSSTTKAIKMMNVHPGRINESGLDILVYPNPSPTTFTLEIKSDMAEPAALVVVNQLGQVIELRSNILPGQKVTLGSKYLPGIYYAKFIQGSLKKAVKLLKL